MKKSVVKTCNVQGCPVSDDLYRGLCGVHWNTYRGFADPEPGFVEVADADVALP